MESIFAIIKLTGGKRNNLIKITIIKFFRCVNHAVKRTFESSFLFSLFAREKYRKIVFLKIEK